MEVYLEQGGPILKILIGINILGYSIIIFKLVEIFFVGRDRELLLKSFKRELDLYKNSEISFSDKLSAALEHFMVPQRKGLNTLKIIFSIAPLLGLLGTVLGIFETFSQMTELGLDDPKLFAGGITKALVTTVAGLLVAIPHLMAFHFFNSSLLKKELQLEESFLKSQDEVRA